MDINTAVGRKRGIPEDKLQAVDRWAEHPGFTPRERAALGYAEMVTISPNDISDAQFAELSRHFNDRQIVELTLQASFENFRARVNRSLRIEDDGFAKLPVDKMPKAF
jgi:alkylhydroperoxidase family enzyme